MGNKKYLYVVVFSLLPFAALHLGYGVFLEAEIVESIEIIGNKNISTAEILGKMKLKKGHVYDEDVLKEDIENIRNIGAFEEVFPEISTTTESKVRVTLKIKEYPKIKKIEFRGNRAISDNKLRSELKLKENEFFTLDKLYDDINKILSLYKEKAYADCRVEHGEYVDEKKGMVTVVFFIYEGSRILVKDIKVSGNRGFSTRKILKLMETKKKKFFKEDVFQKDKNKILEFYKNNGYLKVRLADEVRYNKERTEVEIVLNLSEGDRFYTGEVSFSGNSVFSNDALYKVVKLKKNKVFNNSDLERSKLEIRSLYADKGYINADVKEDLIENTQTKKIDIVFEIDEKFPVYVNEIYIEGNEFTKTNVLLREFLLKPGDILYAKKLRRSIEQLYNLGFIDDVKVDLHPTERADYVDLIVTVTEGKPGMASAGMGYSSQDKLLGTLQVQHLNLFGRAYRLNLLWEFGERRQNYEIYFNTPWIFNKPISTGINVFNTIRRQSYGQDINAYDDHRQGLTLRFTPRILEYLGLSVSYTYQKMEYLNVKPEYENKLYLTPLLSSITLGIIHDTRDNIFDPSRGARNAFYVEFTGGILGGDAHYYKPTFTSSWFLPTFWKFVFSAGFRCGLLKEYIPGQPIPATEYFRVGGADTVRGYNYGEIGPEIGGKVMFISNFEYKFPLATEKERTILQGAFFVDIGGSWNDFSEFDFTIGENKKQLKAGVGFGVRLTTPVFPIRFDWGYGLNKTYGDKLQFYFTIGSIYY